MDTPPLNYKSLIWRDDAEEIFIYLFEAKQERESEDWK